MNLNVMTTFKQNEKKVLKAIKNLMLGKEISGEKIVYKDLATIALISVSDDKYIHLSDKKRINVVDNDLRAMAVDHENLIFMVVDDINNVVVLTSYKYGSCSLCDTLKYVEEALDTDFEKSRAYLDLVRHLVEKITFLDLSM